VNGLPWDPVEAVAEEIRKAGGTAVACPGDVATEEGAQGCIQKALDEFGRLDILISNAGVFPEENETDKYSYDAMEQLIHSNVVGHVVMTKLAIPHLQKSKGNIVYAGSESGMNGMPFYTVYGGTKGFVHAFMRGVAVEQARHGVRANAVCPGPIDTAWLHPGSGPMTAKTQQLAISAVALGRLGTPEEVANVYAFLASAEASYVTGSLYLVDGAITITKSAVGAMADRSLKKEPEGELDLRHQHEGRAELH
jgi:NAD(P)-dependent dehydrogenase (short-subunit alcohol dehydrogenase family)